MDDKIETGADASTKQGSYSADEGDVPLSTSESPVAGPLEVESSRASLREYSEPADWDDPFARQLKKLLLTNMRTVFENATKRIIDCGYEEAVARKAVLRCGGLYQRGNYLVSNVVNDVLASLKKGKGGDMFQDLQQLLEYAMVGMISVLRLLDPSLPIAEAMWRLLLFDINIFNLCELLQCRALLEESSSDSSPRSRSESQNTSISSLSTRYFAGIPYDESQGIYIPRDEKDKWILKLVQKLQELQDELDCWTEWTKCKVRQAVVQTRKAGVEIKSLRREKEEAEALKRKEKTMEDALNNTNKQVENAYSRLGELEVERSVLKNKMEITKVQEETSGSTWQKAFEIEQKALKDVESRDAQRTLLQKELASEKRKAAGLKMKIAKAKKMHNETKVSFSLNKITPRMAKMRNNEMLQVLWEQERKAKEKFRARAASIRKETECLEAGAQKEEDKMRLKSEKDMQKYGDEVKKLEDELSELKVRLWRGTDGFNERVVGYSRSRRCVMCLSEEKMVVFLPCAHQVLCVNCNEVHQKQGMKCCPACSFPITHRVCVRFAEHVCSY